MNLRKLFFFLTAVLLTGALASCGNDDDYTPDYEKPFEFELKVKTNASYRGVSLEFFAPEIYVDWGDGSNPDSFKAASSYGSTKMEHQYPNSSSIDEYTVKITGKGLSSFEILPDPENEDVLASIVKSANFKNCLSLKYVSLLGIDEMKSIDYNQLPALEQLKLTATFFTTLDCSAKGSLKNVTLYNNQLLESVKFPTNINGIGLSGNPNLEEDKVNLKSYANLQFLYLEYTDWESIDISSNKSLTDLTIINSKLKAIDLKSNKELVYLQFEKCDLTEVDLSANNKIVQLQIFESGVNNIIVPANGFPSLIHSDISNNKLDANKLNTIFNALPKKTPSPETTYNISIFRNPGIDGCDANIAKNKGWTVYG